MTSSYYFQAISQKQERSLSLFFDSDCVMGSADLKSLAGSIFFLNNDIAAWYMHMQPMVAVSSTEAE